MSLELVGLVHHNRSTMLAPLPLSDFDPAHVVASAQMQEASGYDRVLVANSAVIPDPHVLGATILAHTRTLQLMLAHRPGFIAPTVAARMLATLDRVSGGRVGVHVIAGPSDRELAADGDFLAKEQRYHRSREYVGILRRLWKSPEAVTHEGEYYRFAQAFMEVKPTRPEGLPVFWGGASAAAVDMGAQCADVYALSGAPLSATAGLVAKVREAAARWGREPEFLGTFLVVIGDTEAHAWRKATEVLDTYLDLRARGSREWTATRGVSNFSSRAGAGPAAAAGERLDRCFWTGMTAATEGTQGNQSTLVGTPEQVTEALMDYYDLGMTRFLLRGYQPLEDAREHGRELFPLIRAAAARRPAATPRAAG